MCVWSIFVHSVSLFPHDSQVHTSDNKKKKKNTFQAISTACLIVPAWILGILRHCSSNNRARENYNILWLQCTGQVLEQIWKFPNLFLCFSLSCCSCCDSNANYHSVWSSSTVNKNSSLIVTVSSILIIMILCQHASKETSNGNWVYVCVCWGGVVIFNSWTN